MENVKICYKCKLYKPITNFGKLSSSKDGYRYDCNDCRRKYREENKSNITIRQREFYEKHKDVLKEKNKKYRENNSAKIKEQRKEYRSRPDIKEHIKQKNKDYLPIRKEQIKVLRKTDTNFQLSEILRSKIHKMLKNKTTTYQNIIGCDIFHLKKWLEFRFDENMNWENLGSYWHIDHILPINAFDLNNETNRQICFHWTNLQPLESKINISKSDKLELHYYFNNIVNIVRFNSIYTSFLGYQTLNESLKWLRKTTSGMVISPHMKMFEKTLETDNPQPSS